MADEKKTYLINIESNLKKYAEDAAVAKKTADELKASLEALKKSGATPAEIEAATAASKNANAEYAKAAKLVQIQTAANNSEKNSRKQLGEILNLQMQALGKLGNAYITNAKGVRELNPLYIEQRKRIAETKQAILDYDKSLNDGRSNIGRYGEAVKASMKEAASSMFAFAAPIAVATAALNGLKEAFIGTEAGAKLLTRAKTQLSAFFENIVAGKFGYAFGKQLPKDIKAAADLMDEIRINDRKDLTEIAEKELEIKNLRLDSVKAGKGSAEQAALLVKALEKENELIDYKVKDKEQELSAVELLLVHQGTNTELLNKQAQLEAEILNIKGEKSLRMATKLQTIEEKRLADAAKYLELTKKQGEQERNDQIALKLVLAKGDPEKMKAAYKFQYEQEIKNIDITNTQKLLKKAEYEQKILDIDKKSAEDAVKALKEVTDAYIEKVEKEGKAAEDLAEWKLNRELINQDNLLQIRELNREWEFDLQRAALDLQYKEEIANAKKTGEDINIINAKYAAARKQIDELETEAKLSLYAGFAGNLATIFGKQTAIGKAAAIAETTINTYTAAMAAYKSLAAVPVVGPALGIVAAAAAVAAGVANVKKIMEVKSGLPGDSSGGSLPTAISSSAPAQRTFAQSAGSTILTQPQLSQTQLNALPQQGLLTAADIAAALSKMPPPVVTVEDINAKTAEVKKVSVRATI